MVISSANGNRYKNGGSKTCVEKAFSDDAGGADVLDALIAGVNIVELDPEDTASATAACRTPTASSSSIPAACTARRSVPAASRRSKACARPRWSRSAVMDQTDHHLLVGKGAQDFARNMGFTIEDDLNTAALAPAWLEWKRRTDPQHYLDPEARAAESTAAVLADGRRRAASTPEHCYGTINCDGINAEGRDLRRDHDQRPGVEDPGPRRRLADPRRRAVRRRRGRRGRLDRPRRGQSLQPVART